MQGQQKREQPVRQTPAVEHGAEQADLSNAFWFGAFLPVAVFAAVNLLLAAQVSSAANELLNQIGTEKWTWLIPAVLGMIVTAYVLGPMGCP
jgi:hypothetical protein